MVDIWKVVYSEILDIYSNYFNYMNEDVKIYDYYYEKKVLDINIDFGN